MCSSPISIFRAFTFLPSRPRTLDHVGSHKSGNDVESEPISLGEHGRAVKCDTDLKLQLKTNLAVKLLIWQSTASAAFSFMRQCNIHGLG